MQTIEKKPAIETVPNEVLEAYSLLPERIQKLGGGLVNMTFLVEADCIDRPKAVLQKLGQVIDPKQTEDLIVYTNHLHDAGWESPIPLTTTEGAFTTQDHNGNYWRSLQHIPADSQPPQHLTAKHTEKLGNSMGRWHSTMRWLDYTPKFSIPHYRDTTYHATLLEQNLSKLPSTPSKNIANALLHQYQQLGSNPGNPRQFIHGDTKIDNILFRNGKPITLIDLDTVMQGAIWLDIGDSLRSIASLSYKKSGVIDHDQLESFITGYFDSSRPGIQLKSFTRNSLQSATAISLELAMRYLNDIVTEDYFGWDETTYQSRHDHHLARAKLYQNIATSIMQGGK